MFRHARAAALLALIACEDGGMGSGPGPVGPVEGSPPPSAADATPGPRKITAPLAAETAPPASPRLGLPPVERLTAATRSYFEGHVGRRLYVQVDKPLYQPGETVWLRAWDLRARDLAAEPGPPGVTVELVGPRGAPILTKRVQLLRGVATNDLLIPEGIEGGEYLVRVTSEGAIEERPIIVSVYSAPRFKKKLELLKKAYGPGDEVTATIEVKRPTGEPLADTNLRGRATVDGQVVEELRVTTGAEGAAFLRFKLPPKIERGDGLLTLLVDDGGVTESVTKRIPILLKKVELAFFPEGGAMVSGLPTRLYFEAKTPLGKPADVEGRILDDHGQAVATFASHHDGLGRFAFTPATGRSYSAEITRPVGVTERYALPIASEEGCALRTYDDLDGQLTAIRVGVRCTAARKVVVAAVLRDNLLDAAALEVPEGGEAVAALEPKDAALARAQGVARITLFDEQLQPIAERIVYRNRRSKLEVKITADRPSYAPREQVALTLETRDEQGAPVAAELALEVVDDTVLSYADDKVGHMLSRVYLEQEIPGKIEEPRPYFDLTEPKSALALDCMMGARGWRRFEWAQVLEPQAVFGMPGSVATGAGPEEPEAAPEDDRAPPRKGGAIPQRPAVPRPPAPPPAPPPAAKPAQAPAPARQEPKPVVGGKLDAAKAKEQRAPAKRELAVEKQLAGGGRNAEGFAGIAADELGPMDRPVIAPPGWAPVRVFPAPSYRGDEPAIRTDFRETIHWVPSVTTGKSGRATVTFYLSDAVTSFRAIAEGVGAGRLGRAEEVVRSSLPFSMDVRLPLEVSAGDRVLAPLTLTNDRDRPLPLSLTASFGELVRVERAATLEGGQLAPSARASLFYGLTVGDKAGKSLIKLSATAGGLSDEVSRELSVVPLGFPQESSASGTLKERASHDFDLGAAIPGSAELTLKLYPSPVATMISGMDGLLREPSGCFEQTSSSNYPNVMVLDYLKTHEVADVGLMERTNGLLERGYQRLVGYETKEKGYEWFGQAPAHEALTAYGLVEFVDMKRVMGAGDEAMIARTARYLESRKDGTGGYKRDGKALDSFGRASAEVTDAYITWALSEAGLLSPGKELERSAALARGTKDEYLLGLAAGTLLNARRSEGAEAARRLAGLQGPDGAWTRADHSITRSTGINLHIETTSLALLALMKAGVAEDGVRRGVEWLAKNRGGYGQWGATQATVLALRAMSVYANLSRKAPTPGTVIVRVNGREAGRLSYEAGRREPLVFTGLGAQLGAGKNTIELSHDGQGELPYSMALEYRSVKPATAPDVVVDLSTRLEKTELKMGEVVRLTATVTNKTASGQPMTLARLGLPGGLTFQPWQLKELREKGLVAFWEVRAREVILYFRELAPSETKTLGIDLVAQVPGTYTGPASSAYLYYGNDKKVWVEPLKVNIATP